MNTRDKRHPRERYGVVLYRNDNLPHPHSPAALALQVLDYWRHDETVFRGDRWMEFKTKFLKDFVAQHGKVFCHWCKREDLKLKGDPDKHDTFVVTLDHLVPCSRGGGLYDPNNVVPCCFRCNNYRSQLNQDERQVKKHERQTKRCNLTQHLSQHKSLDKSASFDHNSLLNQP